MACSPRSCVFRLRSWLIVVVLAALALAAPGTLAQSCGNWLPGPTAPDFGYYGAVGAMGISNAELYAFASSSLTSSPRVFVLRSGLWQSLPWDDAGFGQILRFTTDGGQPATLTGRTVSTSGLMRTVEYAVRTFNGTSWTVIASMQQTIGLSDPLLSFGGMTIYNGSWYMGTIGAATGSLYRSSGTAISLLATTDADTCVQIPFGGCAYFDPRSILALQIGLDGLYVGGRFNSITPAGGSAVASTNLIRYNGTQFQALASQPNSKVRGMLLEDAFQFGTNGLIVWGDFSQVGALAASSIARWSSSSGTWSTLGAGLDRSAAAVVQVSGVGLNSINFVAIGAYPVGVANTLGCAKWTGSAWQNFGGDTVETSLGGATNATCAVNFSGVIAGGNSLSVNNSPRFGLTRWSGTSWDYIASQQGTDGASRAAAVHNTSVYVGGDFTHINSVLASHVARRNPTTNVYEPLGSGVNGQVLALTSFGGELIAGGTFTTAGGNAAVNVAAWNAGTSSWRALGAGLDGAVRGFTTWNGSLVAVGSFRNSGATATGSAARWTGTAWVAIDATFNTSDLYAAAVLGTTLHVGGPTGFRRFNGTAFEVVGGNVAGTVYTLFSLLGSIYVGGDFATVGSPSLTYRRIARWSGTQWFAASPNGMGDFFTGSVRSIFGTASEIFAGGDFQTQVSASAVTQNIARYDGVQWRPLNTDPPSARVLGGTVLGDRVWAVGEFISIGPGGSPVESFGVGQWAKAPVFSVPPSMQRVCQGDGSGTATFTVQTYGTPAPSLRWRFNTMPLSDNLRISGSATPTLMIAAITGADVGSYDCVATDTCAGTTTSPSAMLAVGGCCAPDFNHSGALEVQDIFDFLNAWFAGSPSTDYNHSGLLEVQDIFDFLNAWFGGC